MGGYYTPPPGGGGGGLPSIAASVRRNGNTAGFSVDLLAAPNGLYSLNDVVSITEPDTNANLDYFITWTANSGLLVKDQFLGTVRYYGDVSYQGLVALFGAQAQNGIALMPMSVQALPATPLTVTFVVTTNGGIGTAVPTGGHAGTGYVIGDTVQPNAGSSDAVLTVASVGAGGSVLTLTVTTKGSTYTVASGVVCDTLTGIGAGLEVDLTLADSEMTFDYSAVLVKLR